MTINDYRTFVSEFRHKIAPSVRKHIQDGNIELTNKMKSQLREAMGLSKDTEVPIHALRYLPKAIEPQENPSETELFVLVTMSMPKMINGALIFDRANSTDVKIITKVCPDKVIFISGGELTEFKKSRTKYVRPRAISSILAVETPLDSLLPTFVRNKTLPKFPAKVTEAPQSIETAAAENTENAKSTKEIVK